MSWWHNCWLEMLVPWELGAQHRWGSLDSYALFEQGSLGLKHGVNTTVAASVHSCVMCWVIRVQNRYLTIILLSPIAFIQFLFHSLFRFLGPLCSAQFTVILFKLLLTQIIDTRPLGAHPFSVFLDPPKHFFLRDLIIDLGRLCYLRFEWWEFVIPLHLLMSAFQHFELRQWLQVRCLNRLIPLVPWWNRWKVNHLFVFNDRMIR